MKSIILANSSNQLGKILNRMKPDEVEIVVISTRIDPILLDRRYSRHNYSNLIPPLPILHNFLEYGYDDLYVDRYMTYLKTPMNYLFLNQIIYNLSHRDVNMVLVCEKEESEFQYIELLAKAIKGIYQVKCVTYKDWKKGKTSKSVNDRDTLCNISKKIYDVFKSKVIDSGYDIPIMMNELLPKKRVKELPKKLKKLYIRHIEDIQSRQ